MAALNAWLSCRMEGIVVGLFFLAFALLDAYMGGLCIYGALS